MTVAFSTALSTAMSTASSVDPARMPRHVGIIMDGNGRWAERRGKPRSEGHRAGSHSVRRIVRLARRIGVRALTLYAFSFQNWQRPDDEVAALMGLLHEYLLNERSEILDNGIRLTAVGELGELPALVRAVLDRLCADSAQNRGMTLTLALSYGGQEEIAAAARHLAQRVAAGELPVEDIDVGLLSDNMPSLSVGPPDLIIRTGGERRLSNFLLYGSAYAELEFSDLLWPEFTEDAFLEAIAGYQRRERRFGQVAPSSVVGASVGGRAVGASIAARLVEGD